MGCGGCFLKVHSKARTATGAVVRSMVLDGESPLELNSSSVLANDASFTGSL
jgi:ferric-dicitrate binding protein FerR (iron transport regulator)